MFDFEAFHIPPRLCLCMVCCWCKACLGEVCMYGSFTNGYVIPMVCTPTNPLSMPWWNSWHSCNRTIGQHCELCGIPVFLLFRPVVKEKVLSHRDPVRCVKYNSSFKQVITCCDGSVCLWHWWRCASKLTLRCPSGRESVGVGNRKSTIWVLACTWWSACHRHGIRFNSEKVGVPSCIYMQSLQYNCTAFGSASHLWYKWASF